MKFIYVLIFISLASAELETLNIEEFENANLNDLIDRSIPQISQFIINHGLDPFNLPQTEKKLWLNLNASTQAKPIPYKATLLLHSGILRHLSDLKRYGDATANYEDKLLKLDVGFEFEILEGSYDFIIRLLLIHLEGRVSASTTNVRAKFSVTFDTTNMFLCLDKFEVQIPSKIKVTIENKNGKLDWVTTLIAKAVAPFFKDTLVDIIQKEGTKAIQKYLDEMNKFFENLVFKNNGIMNQYS